MKVLQLINVLIRGGGAEKLVLDHTLALHRLGVEVEVLSLGKPTADGGEFLGLLQQKGIRAVHLDGESLYAPTLFYKFWKHVSTGHYDLVHVHLYPSLYYAALYRLLSGSDIPLVFTEHSTSNKRRGHWAMHKLDAFFYPNYTSVVCISNRVRESLLQHVPGLKSTPVIPNGIDIPLFREAVPLQREILVPSYRRGDRLLMMNARFVPAKDHNTLLKAMQLLPENVHLLLLGAGPLEAEYRKFCEQHGLQQRVHFLGVRKDVPELLATVDIIVHSSHYEGFSISMLEGMASGKPIVASSVPGIVDLVDQVAILTEHENERELAAAIAGLLEDPKLAQEVATRCREFVDSFSITNVSEMYLSLYRQCLNS